MPFKSLTNLLGLLAMAHAAPYQPVPLSTASKCPDFNGTFSIENYRLYPENLDWDPVHCKLYLSANFNASVLVYDPYRATYDILTFDGITDTEPFHVSGIDYDASTKSIIIQANSGTPFVTNGADISGPNKVIRYDTTSKKVAYIADLAGFVAQTRVGNSTAGGFQDSAEDTKGNAFVPTTFNVGAIAKISSSGEVTPWYIGDATPAPYIYGGLVFDEATNKLIVTAASRGIFQSFDVASDSPAPTDIEMVGRPADGSYPGLGCDGLISPARYSRKVLLCSDNGQAATTLWATEDDFVSVWYIGKVANNGSEEIAKSGTVVATVEMGNSLFVNSEFFNDTGVYDVAGDRASFPLVDSTAEFDALVSAAGFEIITC